MNYMKQQTLADTWPVVLDVKEDDSIKRHEIASRLTNVERKLMGHFSHRKLLIVCVGNIGVGKSSLVKLLAFSTGMNALFELPDEGFEDYLPQNESLYPLLAAAKDYAKRTLGRYYGAINEFIKVQARESPDSPSWAIAKKNLEQGALDIQHAYLDLRKMQLLAVPHLVGSTCVDGSALADRYAFCEVLRYDMDVPYLTEEGLVTIDRRLENEFRHLHRPTLLIILHGPLEYLIQNVRERERYEEREGDSLPEGLMRLIKALQPRYQMFVPTLKRHGWLNCPVLRIDVSKIDFVSNVRHLIAVYEGIERLVRDY